MPRRPGPRAGSDREAEHIPGCKMAFRATLLEASAVSIRSSGSPATTSTSAGGCRRAATLGFSPAAMVWHCRRPSERRYWRQQRSYGRRRGAARSSKWPHHYVPMATARWAGRLYGRGLGSSPFGRARVRYGTRSSEPFESLYRPRAGMLSNLTARPARPGATLSHPAALSVVALPAGPRAGRLAAAVPPDARSPLLPGARSARGAKKKKKAATARAPCPVDVGALTQRSNARRPTAGAPARARAAAVVAACRAHEGGRGRAQSESGARSGVRRRTGSRTGSRAGAGTVCRCSHPAPLPAGTCTRGLACWDRPDPSRAR